MADPAFAALYADGTQYPHPHVAVDALSPVFGPAAATTPEQCFDRCASLADTHGVALAVVLSNDDERITILHLPRRHPTIPGAVTPSDGHYFAIHGTTAGANVLVRLPDNSFRPSTPMYVQDDAAALFAVLDAAGAAPRDGHHVNGAANTEHLAVRRVVVLPTAWTVAAVTASVYTFKDFYTAFIQPIPAGDLPTYAYITDWWRCAATMNGDPATTNAVGVRTRVAIDYMTTPLAEATRLEAWKGLFVESKIGPIRVAAAAAPLTNHGFNTTIAGLTAILQNHHTNTERREHASANPGVIDRWGDVPTRNLLVLCGLNPAVHTEADLPAVHREIAKNKKTPSRDSDVINAALQARAVAAACLANEYTMPVVTTELVKTFRELRAFGTAEQVGGGLSPASIVTVGEPDHEAYKEKTRVLSMLELGAVAVSASDAADLQVNDAKLPGRVVAVAARLEAWTCVLDVFLGEAHIFAVAARNAVSQVSIILHNLENSMAPGPALLVAYRTLYWFQQATFMYMEDVQSGRAPLVPDFAGQLLLPLRMRNHSHLPELPLSWAGPVKNKGTPAKETETRSEGGGRKEVTNMHPPQEQMRRFQASGKRSIKPLTDAAIGWVCPQVAGQDVCLAWYLKGSCYNTCPRKATHQRANDTVKASLTDLLDRAGAPAGSA